MDKSTNEIKAEQRLLTALEDMHNLSSGSLSRVKGIAKCAVRALETDSGARDLEAIAQALKSIIMDAETTANDVGCLAEQNGIQTVDKDWMRRLKAAPRVCASPTSAGGLES